MPFIHRTAALFDSCCRLTVCVLRRNVISWCLADVSPLIFISGSSVEVWLVIFSSSSVASFLLFFFLLYFLSLTLQCLPILISNLNYILQYWPVISRSNHLPLLFLSFFLSLPDSWHRTFLSARTSLPAS